MLPVGAFLCALLVPCAAQATWDGSGVERTGLGAYANGFIVEYGDASRNTDLTSLVSHVARATKRSLAINPRAPILSPLFRGASYDILRADGVTTDDALHAILLQHPDVKGVYPNTKRYLQLPQWHRLVDYGTLLGGEVAGLFTRDDDLGKRQTTGSSPPTTSSPTGNSSSLTNAHAMTGVDKLHAQNVTGRGIKIALLDSGIDASHPTFGGNSSGSGFGPGFKIVAGWDFVGEDPDPKKLTQGSSPVTTCSNHGTATASLAAGMAYKYGFVGVAPDATIEMYKVFKCTGDTDTDTGVNASLLAYMSRADVISVSIGSDGGWGNDLWGIVARRILDMGTLYIVAAGNSGEQGPFTSNGLSSAFDVPNVGSIDNAFSPSLTAQGSYSVDNGPPVPIEYAPGFPANWSMPLTLLPFRGNGCVAYPNTTTNYTRSQVVLVPRPQVGTPGCNQTGRAADAGIRNVLIYNSVDNNPTRPLPVQTTEGFPFRWLDGIGNLDRAVGERLVELLGAGRNVTLDLPWKPDKDNRALRLVRNDISGGFVSNYSTWGPTYEAKLQTSVSAPGGFLTAAGATLYGGLVIASGTSFSAPYVAGIAALVKQAHPSLSPRDIMNRIVTTAHPVRLQDAQRATQPLLAPVFQQGAGLVDAYAAVRTTTVVNESSLAFNDTSSLQPLGFRVVNNGSEEVLYEIAHRPAATVYTFLPGNSTITRFSSPGYANSSITATVASLNFSRSSFTLRPGAAMDITVRAAPPDLDKPRLPLYSGFVSINGSNGDTLMVPYGGIGGALRDVPVLDTSPGQNRTYLISNSVAGVNGTDRGARNVYVGPQNNSFVVPRSEDLRALGNTSLPGYLFQPVFGSRLANVSLVQGGAGGGQGGNQTASVQVVGPVRGYAGDRPPEYYVRNTDFAGVFNGQLANGSFVPNGTYRFMVRMLRVTGDVTRKADWDVAMTGEFVLNITGG